MIIAFIFCFFFNSQLSIQHFDHRMLRHVKTKDHSEPRLWRVPLEGDARTKESLEEEEHHTTIGDKRRWDVEEMKLETSPTDARSQDVVETSPKEATSVTVGKETIDGDVSAIATGSSNEARVEKQLPQLEDEKSPMQTGKDEMDSLIRHEERAVNDKEAQCVPDIDVVNFDESLTLHDEASEQINDSCKQLPNKNDNIESNEPLQQQKQSVNSSHGLNRKTTEIGKTSDDDGKETEANQEVTKMMRIHQVRLIIEDHCPLLRCKT